MTILKMRKPRLRRLKPILRDIAGSGRARSNPDTK